MPNPLSKTITRVKGLFGKNRAATTIDPHIIPRDHHSISRRDISEAALKVMSGLHQAGFQGFLVGGGVRDLLLGLHPKDFDVATDATPEEVRRVFRNSRIIGRRFKIVHVRFGREVIEVTTFRGSHQAQESSVGKRPQNQQSARTSDGMLLRDNVFGTVEEDAIRRDLTINALYYSSSDFCVYDYTDGLKDIEQRTIRVIGDPETRYREDPVRMLRSVRFAAKLDFSLERDTAAPIRQLAPSLADIPAARMFDEILKLFMSGYGVTTYELMQKYGLFGPLFPETDQCLGDEQSSQLILCALENTDARIKAGKPVTPAFIFAALLWPVVQQRQHRLHKDGMPEVPALHQASQEVASRQQQRISIPKRFGMPMREIWDMQLRLPKRNGRRAQQLLENRRFRAAYDFLLLREQSGEDTGGLGDWWTEYQNASEEKRESMSSAVQGSSKRRRRRPNKSRNDAKNNANRDQNH